MGENLEILQNPLNGGSLVHVCTIARILEILDQNSKKKFAGCDGLIRSPRIFGK